MSVWLFTANAWHDVGPTSLRPSPSAACFPTVSSIGTAFMCLIQQLPCSSRLFIAYLQYCTVQYKTLQYLAALMGSFCLLLSCQGSRGASSVVTFLDADPTGISLCCRRGVHDNIYQQHGNLRDHGTATSGRRLHPFASSALPLHTCHNMWRPHIYIAPYGGGYKGVSRGKRCCVCTNT